jgi:hypothetical protein
MRRENKKGRPRAAMTPGGVFGATAKRRIESDFKELVEKVVEIAPPFVGVK